MKRILLLSVSVMMAVCMMAIGNNSGSTKANAIDFDWEAGNVHSGGTKWYRVDLAPLYEEDSPTLSLYLTNPDRSNSVDVSMTATVAGEVEERSYTIAPHQHKSWTADASLLVRLKQREVYITLTSTDELLLSAKVYDATDLDETCKDAKPLNWSATNTQTAGYAAWWKVDLTPVKTATKKDAKITIKNLGSGELTLIAGQSLDCPSSGTTKRTFTIAAGQTMYDTIPQGMINSVMADELYVSFENNQPIQFSVELIDQPATPVISGTYTDIKPTDNFVITAGTHLYRLSVAEMNAEKKYEPEFTYRNEGAAAAKVTTQMAFECPAYGATTNNYSVAAEDEAIEVYKKNMLEGLTGVEYIYLQVTTDADINFSGRMKHVREGKACKTNIDFDWTAGHRQAARTTQWYAIDVTTAKAQLEDLVVYIENEGTATATIKGSIAFSCPYIDLQEMTRSITAGSTVSKKISYSTYAMLSDTIWVGVETNQALHLWAETTPTQTQPADDKCLNAVEFNWVDGAKQDALDTVWYKIGMNEVRTLKHFPTVYVQNLGTAPATVYGELSLECPDVIANETKNITIAAESAYSKTLSRDLFEHISQDTIYIKVVATQDISFEVRLTEEAEGSSCNSAIRFNWVSGNDQAANANLWYAVDLREAMINKKDVKVTIANKDNAASNGSAWLAFTCPFESQQEVNFNLAANATKSKVLPNSLLETVTDSVVYIRLIGNTALHVEAELVDPAPFTTIECPATMTALDWNTLYKQTADTAWYILTGEVLKSLDTLTTTPEIYLHNLSGANNTIVAEVAYHCPITAAMMSKTVTMSNGQELTKLIERATIEQVVEKDSVLIRLIGNGEFEFKAELVNPNTGNDRLHAVRVAFNEAYEQAANTSMWYKIDTKMLKSDQTLHGKSVFISTKNKGGDADIQVEVYEDVSTTDLLEGRAKRTIAAGQSASHNFPAYAIFGVADKEVYVKVTTNQPLTISSALENYATRAADPLQDSAKLAVPNVDYTIEPGTSWFAICVPYIRNNYMLTDASSVVFSNPNAANATIGVTATWLPQCTVATPERSRTIGGGKSVSKTYKELIDMAIERAGYNFSVEGTDSQFLDSVLRAAATSDSLTAYIRITTTQPLNVRINTPQTTGEACANPMAFDWEHGNVNPEGATTWYQVALDSTMIPEGKDLRLHVENWANTPTLAKAGLYFDCDSAALKSIDYTLEPLQDMSKDIDRDLLANLGWADMLIQYNSDKTTRIWVEVIDEQPRDSVVDSVLVYLCDGSEYVDSLTMETHIIDAANPETLHWRDSIEFLNDTAVAMWDSIIYYNVVVLQDPILPAINDVVANVNIKRNQPLDLTSANAWLTNYLDTTFTDSTEYVMEIEWLYSQDKMGKEFTKIAVWNDTAALKHVNNDPIYKEAGILKYNLITECGDTLTDKYLNSIKFHVVDTACAPYVWAGVTYNANAKDSATFSLDNGCDSMVYLDLTVKINPTMYDIKDFGNKPIIARNQPINVTAADTWLKNQFESTKTDITKEVLEVIWKYSIDGTTFQNVSTTPVATEGVILMYEVVTECEKDTLKSNWYTPGAITTLTTDTACAPYVWGGKTYTVSTKDTIVTTLPSGQDSIAYLDLTILADPTLYKISDFGSQPVITRGNAIDVTAADAWLKAQFIADQTDVTKEVTDVTWKYSIDGGTTFLPVTADPINTEAVILMYEVTTECGDMLESILHYNTINTTVVDSVCYEYTWNGTTYTNSFDSVWTTQVNGCDSVVTITITILSDPTLLDINQLTGTPIIKRGQTIDVTAWNTQVVDDLAAQKAANPELANVVSVEWWWSIDGTNFTLLSSTDANNPVPSQITNTEAVSLKYVVYTECTSLTSGQYNNIARDTTEVVACNYYYWSTSDSSYIANAFDSVAMTSATNAQCDSVSYLDLTVNNPAFVNLEAVSKYGNRLLMVNLNSINATTSWNLDPVTGAQYVKWYQEADPEDQLVGEGYYLTKDGEPLVGSFYAVIQIPATEGNCGHIGMTNTLVCDAPAGAPMLMPTMAKPEEVITVYNLDPTVETTIRIYTTDGLIVRTYTTSGQESFQMKANADNGFYLVELTGENMKSTLRYIVK